MLKRAIVVIFVFALSFVSVTGARMQSELLLTDRLSAGDVRPQAFSAAAAGISAPVSSLLSSAGKTERNTSLFLYQMPDRTVLRPRAKSPEDLDAAPVVVSATPMPLPSLSFDGISNFHNLAEYGVLFSPPDMTGDVGPDHYVQAVNSLVQVFSKSGASLTPPFRLSALFAPLGTPLLVAE